jgi:hypothetical protein
MQMILRSAISTQLSTEYSVNLPLRERNDSEFLKKIIGDHLPAVSKRFTLGGLHTSHQNFYL